MVKPPSPPGKIQRTKNIAKHETQQKRKKHRNGLPTHLLPQAPQVKAIKVRALAQLSKETSSRQANRRRVKARQRTGKSKQARTQAHKRCRQEGRQTDGQDRQKEHWSHVFQPLGPGASRFMSPACCLSTGRICRTGGQPKHAAKALG